MVGHGRDSTEGFRRLGVCLDGTGRVGVDTGEGLAVSETRLEGSVLGIVGGVVEASDTVVDVLAVVGGVSTGGVADFEAELRTTHEAKQMNS